MAAFLLTDGLTFSYFTIPLVRMLLFCPDAALFTCEQSSICPQIPPLTTSLSQGQGKMIAIVGTARDGQSKKVVVVWKHRVVYRVAWSEINPPRRIMGRIVRLHQGLTIKGVVLVERSKLHRL